MYGIYTWTASSTLDIAKYLLEKFCSNLNKDSLLLSAVECNNLPLVEYLVKEYNV